MRARVDLDPARALLARCDRGEISPALAAMTLLLDAAGAPDPLQTSLGELARFPQSRVRDEIARLLRDHGARAAQVAAAASGAALNEVEACARFFDHAASASEEAAVALYSLGDPALLDRATRELVTVLASWRVLDPARIALDFGCGIGRVAARLASSLAAIDGVDISPRMIAASRRRCAGIANVAFHLSSGRDLAMFPDARFHLVIAIDTFPYLFSAGPAVLDASLREIARVLRPGGDLVIGNLSYRSDPAADRADLDTLARAHRFSITKSGARLGELWDGIGFHLVRE
jgi:ubiquinone/menaquinone biosynthesis C-methylase UbiE